VKFVKYWSLEGKGHDAFALTPGDVDKCPCCGEAPDWRVPVEYLSCQHVAIGWFWFRPARRVTYRCGGFVMIPLREDSRAAA
jgi:hypothetical protein